MKAGSTETKKLKKKKKRFASNSFFRYLNLIVFIAVDVFYSFVCALARFNTIFIFFEGQTHFFHSHNFLSLSPYLTLFNVWHFIVCASLDFKRCAHMKYSLFLFK